MTNTITILSILNFILAVNSLVSHIVCRIILSFPVVCLVCAIVPQSSCTAGCFIDKFSIFVAVFPIIEMTLFVSIIYLIGQE
jgi:hypothetical protein